MPSKTQLVRNDILVSSGDVGTSLELKKYSRLQVSSKTSKDKALFPRANQTQKFREIKDGNRIQRPHEFVKGSDNAPFVWTNPTGNHQPIQLGMNGGYIDGELIRYMSSLPGYLQQGDNAQDNVLNFGVLDWERLEKWTRKQNRILSRDGASTPSSSSLSSLLSSSGRSFSESTNVSSVASNKVKSQRFGSRKKQPVDSGESSSQKANPCQRIQAHSEKVMNTPDMSKFERSCLGEKPRYTGKDKSFDGRNSEVNFLKKEAGNSDGIYEGMGMGTSSSKSTSNVSLYFSREKTCVLDDKPEKMVENFEVLGCDPAHRHDHRRRAGIVLLLPKDFSKSGCLDDSQRTSCEANSAELNSFSNVFSIEELRLEDSIPDIPHSCPLPFMAETGNDLDLNLEKLILAQRKSFPSDQPSLSCLLNHKVSFQDEAKRGKNDVNDSKSSIVLDIINESKSSTVLDTSQGLEHKFCDSKSSRTRDPSPARQFSFGIGRMARSFSFKEDTALPRLSYSSIKSGPARAPTLESHDYSTHETAGAAAGPARSSPLRRLLDPLLKPKANKPDHSHPSIERLNDLSIKMINVGQNGQNEKSRPSMMVKAIIYLTVKNGLPLFKFLVESKHEILASSVKRLSPMRRDDPCWLYTFYSVQKTKRKGSSWKYQGSKGRGSKFCYNVIGQLKVSEPCSLAAISEDSDFVEKFTTISESVLHGIDLSNVNAADSDFTTNEELGAIVFQNPKRILGNDEDGKYDNNAEKNIAGHIVVILPSGVHSLPNEGGPSSLISRWRSGGSCDCGGWDVGCKVQILTNNDQEIPRRSRACADQHDCNLFLQGPPNKQNNHPVLRLIAHGDGAMYSIEYHAAISSLQAFAIAVAVLSSQDQPDDTLDSTNSHNEARKGHCRSKSAIFQGEGTAKYATNPPLSPVGRA